MLLINLGRIYEGSWGEILGVCDALTRKMKGCAVIVLIDIHVKPSAFSMVFVVNVDSNPEAPTLVPRGHMSTR
jgi:hypothetical protein